MNKNVIARAAGGVLAAFLLVGAMSSTAAAADAKPEPPQQSATQPLVQSKANTGISVGGLLDIGASNTVNGTSADSGVKVHGPAGVSTNISNDTNVGIDVLTDLAATVTAAIG
ncbi:hypothetical protein ACQB60_04720 [Actinomycetota bacterium Odt1-20B]